MALHYVQGLSEKSSGIFKYFNIKIASRNVNNISRFFETTKDRILKLDTADVVYKIPCTIAYFIYLKDLTGFSGMFYISPGSLKSFHTFFAEK